MGVGPSIKFRNEMLLTSVDGPVERTHRIYRIVPSHTVPYHTIPYCTIPYCTVLQYRTAPYRTIPYCTVLYHTVPYHTVPYYTVPYHTIPYHTIPYHTVPYRIVPYRSIFRLASSPICTVTPWRVSSVSVHSEFYRCSVGVFFPSYFVHIPTDTDVRRKMKSWFVAVNRILTSKIFGETTIVQWTNFVRLKYINCEENYIFRDPAEWSNQRGTVFRVLCSVNLYSLCFVLQPTNSPKKPARRYKRWVDFINSHHYPFLHYS